MQNALTRIVRGGARRAQMAGLRASGRLLHPVLHGRGPIGGLSLTRDVVRKSRGSWLDLDPEREIRFGTEDSEHFTATPTFCAVVKGARVLGDSASVISPDNRLLIDVSPAVARPAWRHPDLERAWLPPIQTLGGRVAVIASVLSLRYYHWMFDMLPRLELLARAGTPFDQVIVHTDFAFQRETLAHLGVKPEQIVPIHPRSHFLCDELILPSLPAPFGTPTPEVFDFLRRSFLPESDLRPAEKIFYVSRKDATRRRIINEGELIARLEKYGVETVLLDGMSVAEQVALFRAAKLVIGPHGAGFTNMVFAQPGAALLEFMPDAFRNPCFQIVTNALGIHYKALSSRSAGGQSLDQIIEIDAVERALDGLLAEISGSQPPVPVR